MFYLALKDVDVDALTKIAKKKGITIEQLAWLAYRKGMSFLMSIPPTRFTGLDAFIQEHWELKTDREIGYLFHPPIPESTVRCRRYALGLKKWECKKYNALFLTQDEREEFERLVFHEGYTITDYKREKNIKCTHQSLCKILTKCGLKHSPKARAPEWKTRRKARKQRNERTTA